MGYQRMYRYAAPVDKALLQSFLPLGWMRISPAESCLGKSSGKVVTNKLRLPISLQLTYCTLYPVYREGLNLLPNVFVPAYSGERDRHSGNVTGIPANVTEGRCCAF